MKIKYTVAFLSIIALSISAFTSLNSESPKHDFLSMKGILSKHYYEDKTDIHSEPEILELQDEQGVTIWFAKHIFRDVCMTGECKMIRLWLFWDGVGNYLGMQIPEDEPLTKSDHTEFEEADYNKLEMILKDTLSILKDLNSDDLIVADDSIDLFKAYEVDGYTAATQPALAEVVVKDAVYTCHTLWHTVYGPIQHALHEIQESRIEEDFLKMYINSEKPEYNFWVIDQVKKFKEYHDVFYQDIINLIKSDNPDIAKKALNYFNKEHLENEEIQRKLADVIPLVSTHLKYDILWKFIALGEVNQDIALKLLNYLNDEELGVGALNLIYRIIPSEHLKNGEIFKLISELSEHENAYIRNLSLKFLKEEKNVH